MADEPAYITSGLQRWRRVTDAPLLVIAIGSLPLLLLELHWSSLTGADRTFLTLVNVAVLIAFAVDYLVELVLARPRGQYVRHEWTSLAIVIAQAIAVVPGLGAFGILRAARGARAIRAVAVLLRLLAIGGAAGREGRTILRRHAARFALGFAALTWLTSAVAFALAENVGEGQRLESFFDALWWATETITTVGYGDVYPVTAAGRLVGAFTMVVGISTFAVVTAKIAEYLVRSPAPAASESEPDGPA